MSNSGTLYIVATPIGNLGDMTYRAIATLKEVDLIACEDTRVARVLLNHYQIQKPTVSYHNFNERAVADKILARVEGGESVAIISDAGTPSISDPGFIIVREAARRNLPIIAIPGPSAVITALAMSGLPTDAFIFYGFLPPTEGKRRTIIESLKDRRETLIFYESPYKIHKLIDQLASILGERQVVLCRELTKRFEETIRGTLPEIQSRLVGRVLKGEITVVVQGNVRKTVMDVQ